MPVFVDLTGKVFGKITVMECDGKRGNTGYWWKTKCECGALKSIRGAALSSGRTVSCGCSAKDWCRTQGMEGAGIYNIWAGMKQRCQNPKYHGYAQYGGRGIKVCERWQSFENFYADMGDKPSGKTLDREQVDGDYEPDNCRWATPTQQARNKRSTIMVDGIPLAALAEQHGIERKKVEYRYRNGYRGPDLVAKKLPHGKLSKRYAPPT